MSAFHFRVSRRRDKKYDAVFDNGRVVPFGGIRKNGVPYDQFRDQTGIGAYSKYDHNDEQRRARYYMRHGPFNKMKPYTADWFSAKYLW
jgi:hypothetical protein